MDTEFSDLPFSCGSLVYFKNQLMKFKGIGLYENKRFIVLKNSDTKQKDMILIPIDQISKYIDDEIIRPVYSKKHL